MKITYDKFADALYISLKKGKVFSTKEINDNVIADFDAENNIIGLEVLDASKNLGGLKKQASIIIGRKELKLPALIS